MNVRFTGTRRVLGAAVAAAVLMGSGIGIGVALTGGASAAAGGAATARGNTRPACLKLAARHRGASCGRRLLRLALLGGIHGQVTFKSKKGFASIAFERGAVQSVSGGTLTVRAADGTTWTWHLVKGSVIRENGRQVAASKLARGEQVLVAGPVVSGVNDVKVARIRAAA